MAALPSLTHASIFHLKWLQEAYSYFHTPQKEWETGQEMLTLVLLKAGSRTYMYHFPLYHIGYNLTTKEETPFEQLCRQLKDGSSRTLLYYGRVNISGQSAVSTLQPSSKRITCYPDLYC